MAFGQIGIKKFWILDTSQGDKITMNNYED